MGDGEVGDAGGAPGGEEIAGEDGLNKGLLGKVRESATDVAVGVAVLQATGEDRVEGYAGDHSELAGLGDGAGEGPRGDGHTHPALDHNGERNSGHTNLQKDAQRASWGQVSAAPKDIYERPVSNRQCLHPGALWSLEASVMGLERGGARGIPQHADGAH